MFNTVRQFLIKKDKCSLNLVSKLDTWVPHLHLVWSSWIESGNYFHGLTFEASKSKLFLQSIQPIPVSFIQFFVIRVIELSVKLDSSHVIDQNCQHDLLHSWFTCQLLDQCHDLGAFQFVKYAIRISFKPKAKTTRWRFKLDFVKIEHRLIVFCQPAETTDSSSLALVMDEECMLLGTFDFFHFLVILKLRKWTPLIIKKHQNGHQYEPISTLTWANISRIKNVLRRLSEWAWFTF